MARKPLGKQIRVQVLVRDNYRCKMCGRTKDEVPLEVDHIIPISDGGTDELCKLATLCRDCNRGKSAYHFNDYNSIRVMPDNIEKHFKFFQDDKIGAFELFHLYTIRMVSTRASFTINGEFHILPIAAHRTPRHMRIDEEKRKRWLLLERLKMN